MNVLFETVFDHETVFGLGIAANGAKVVVGFLEELPDPFLSVGRSLA
jgi:hypothetical protein